MSEPQRLPNLYQLLGLGALESNRDKIAAAIGRAQTKAEALKADAARAADVARLQKVVALAQKYLLGPELKSSYDAQWKANYSSTVSAPATSQSTASAARANAPAVVAASTQSNPRTSAKSSTASASPSASTGGTDHEPSSQLSWDMAALEALLPPADPHAPFQMADYLRTSQVRDPLAAEADLHKLISLLGGEVTASSQPVVSQTIGLQHLSDGLHSTLSDGESAMSEPEMESGLSMPRSTNSVVAVGLAKRMRQKRQQAILFGGTVLMAGVGGLVLLGFYLNQPAKPTPEVAQLPVPSRPKPPPAAVQPAEPTTENSQTVIQPPGSGGLIQPGGDSKPLEIQATPMTKPDAMAMPEKPAEPMKPEPPKPEPTKPEPPKPEPTKPEPPKPEPPKPEPAKPETEPAKPEAKPEEPADVKLNGKEKKQWQEQMKRARASLAKLDAAASENLLGELKPLAKNAQQRAQLTTLEQAVGLIRKAREAIVAGIGGLESAETFTVGTSTEVSFIEGDETRIIVRSLGGRQEHKLEAMPVGMGVALMKLKPNVIDANLDAAMGAYIMVQPKATAKTAEQGQKLLEEAAAVGAISKELAQFYKDDYKLP